MLSDKKSGEKKVAMQFKTHGYWGCSLKSKPHYFSITMCQKDTMACHMSLIALDMAYGILRQGEIKVILSIKLRERFGIPLTTLVC